MSSRHVRTKRPLVLESYGLPPPAGENKNRRNKKTTSFRAKPKNL